MQKQGGPDKLARHLRITYSQRTAFRAVNRLEQGCRRVGIQNTQGQFVKGMANLHSKRCLRPAEKQKYLERLVIKGTRVNFIVL